MSTETTLQRVQMVKEQLARRGIQDEAILQAMADVPRHHFIESDFANLAYEDTALPIQAGQTISQPYIVARMMELLELKSSDKVLDVGTGSGYAAAVMSRIVAAVYSIERQHALAQRAAENLAAANTDHNIYIRHGDGTLGWPEHAPYDAISVAAGGPKIPKPLLEQLAIDGRLVIPVGMRPRAQRLIRIRKVAENSYKRETFDGVRFVPLIGEAGWDAEEMEQMVIAP